MTSGDLPAEDDEAARRVEQDRGRRAARIADDELFRAAVEAVRNDIRKLFETSNPEDDRARLVARLKFDALTEVVNKLLHHVRTGKLAEEQLSRWERMKEAIKKRRAA